MVGYWDASLFKLAVLIFESKAVNGLGKAVNQPDSVCTYLGSSVGRLKIEGSKS